MAVVSEAEWQARFYDLLCINNIMDKNEGDSLTAFHEAHTGLTDEGKLVLYISVRRNGNKSSCYFRRHGRQVLLDDDVSKIAYRMCELIPGLREKLLLFPEQLYCPPVLDSTISFSNICEKDAMHELGLKRGSKYSYQFLHYKFSQFFEAKRAMQHHSEEDIQRMEIKAAKVTNLECVRDQFAAEQAAIARKFVQLVVRGNVLTSFEANETPEYLSLGNMGKQGEGVASLFQRLLSLSFVRFPFILSDNLIEPFQVVIDAAILTGRLFYGTYRPPALDILKKIYDALVSSPNLSVFFLFDHALSVRTSSTSNLHNFLEFVSASDALSRRVEVAWGDPGVCTHLKFFGDGEQVAFLGSCNGSKASLYSNVETLYRVAPDKALFLNQVYVPFLFDHYYLTLDNDPLSGKSTDKVKSGYHGVEELPEVMQEVLLDAEKRLRAVLRNYLGRLNLYSPVALSASTEPVIPLLRQLAQRVGIELHDMPRGYTATMKDTHDSALQLFSQIEPFKTLLYSHDTQPAAVVCLTASMGLPAVTELIRYKGENPDTTVVVIADKFNETDFHAMLIQGGILVARCGDNMFHLKIFSSFYDEASDARNYESYGSPNWSPSAMFGPNDAEIGVGRNGTQALSAMAIAAVVIAATFDLGDELVDAIGGGNMALDK